MAPSPAPSSSEEDDDDDSDYGPPTMSRDAAPAAAPASDAANSSGDDGDAARSNRKRQKTSHDEDDTEDDIDDEEEDEDEDERNELLMKRWISGGDRSAMLKLLRHEDGEAAMYDFQLHKMVQRDLKVAVDVVGDYDLVFVCGWPNGTDQGWADRPIARTLRRGTLSINIEEDEDVGRQRQQVVGTITNIKGHCVQEVGDSGAWEYYLQMNDVEFRQVENGHFHGDALPAFQMTKLWGTESLEEEFEVSIRILTNSGTLPWIPAELRHYQTLPGREDHEYIRFIQEQIEKVKSSNYSCYWKEEASWLCNHMGFSGATARHVHSFLRHELPSELKWAWQKGDLVVQLEMTEYATSWNTWYIARPRDDYVRERLLRQVEGVHSSLSE